MMLTAAVLAVVFSSRLFYRLARLVDALQGGAHGARGGGGGGGSALEVLQLGGNARLGDAAAARLAAALGAGACPPVVASRSRGNAVMFVANG